MTQSTLQYKEKKYALWAGLLYLIIALTGGFSIAYMPSAIIVEDNAALSFQNLLEQQELFRWGIAGDITVMVLEILLSVLLYRLFKSLGNTAMTIATYSRFAMAIVMGTNLINYMIPSIVMSQPEYLNVFSAAELESLTLLFFKAHKYGELIWQIFFSVHLFFLGYVIRKSTKTPKYLGSIMLIGSIGYGGDSFSQLTLTNSEILVVLFSSLLVLAVVAELWFAFWLLIKGKKKEVLA